MATNRDEYEPLRNRAVDYDRTDLSPRGILVFLVGLLVAGIFIELVIWGMFRFLSHSPFFAKGNQSPMVTTQKASPLTAEGKDFENTSNVNPNVFPEPRLQTNDAVDMKQLLDREHKILYAEQPFVDQSGTVHLPINEAMKLVVERGLPVKPAGGAATAVTQKAVPPAKATAAPAAE
ncbi:MAG TPA: hypothetical protein VMU45_15040 [Candidatus Eisenbacteria bacterium]|nr:hypothetical protein [Candidatus Eisenbacteria bacterium]